MLPWLAITYTTARLGFEAQNAAAFRLMRLVGGPSKTAAEEIVPHTIALPPEPVREKTAARKRRHAASKIIHKKSKAVKKRGKSTKVR
jgi:hypothetical protein